MRYSPLLYYALCCAVILLALSPGQAQGGKSVSAFGDSTPISCSDSFNNLKKNAIRLNKGKWDFFAGYQQFDNNQNPVVVAFKGKSKKWCAGSGSGSTRPAYENDPPDSRAYGLIFDGKDLYGVFSIDGGPGYDDLVKSTNWFHSYGNIGGGGGPKVTVVVRLNKKNGKPLNAVFLGAKLSSGRVNSYSCDSGKVFTNKKGKRLLKLKCGSFYHPFTKGKKHLNCDNNQGYDSPFPQVMQFTANLKKVKKATIPKGCQIR